MADVNGPLPSTEGSLIGSALAIGGATAVAWITAKVRPRKASIVEEWRDFAQANEDALARANARITALEDAVRGAQAETVRCHHDRRRLELLIQLVLIPEIERHRRAAGLGPLVVPSILADLLDPTHPPEGDPHG